MIKSIIHGGGKNRYAAEVDSPENEASGLVVSTRELKQFTSYYQYFFNDSFGIELNQRAVSSGTPEYIYNGTDTRLWNASSVGEAFPVVPYAHWHLNETSGTTVSDSSGNGRTGTTVNMETVDWQPGKLNNCLTFDGVDEWVNFGNIASYSWDSSFSLECWFSTTTTGTDYLISKWLANVGYYIRMTAGQIGVVLQSANNRRAWIRTVATYNNNVWHHLVFTYRGTRDVSGMTLYMDGLPATVTTLDDDLNGPCTNAANFQLSGYGGATDTWLGSLDECVVYSSVLTQSEVTIRYNAGVGLETFPGWEFASGAQNHTPGGSKSLGGTNVIHGSIAQLSALIELMHGDVVRATEPSFALVETTDGQRISLNQLETVTAVDAHTPASTIRPTVKTGSITLNNYTALSGWIYITGWGILGTKQVNVFGYNLSTGLTIGITKNIGDYVTTTILNTWQKFTIPLGDLELTDKTIQALRIAIVSSGGGVAPSFYLDDLQLDGKGTTQAIEYTLEPDDGEWLHIEDIKIILADNIAGTLANNSMPSLSYDALLGLPALTSGVFYQRIQENTVTNVANLKTLGDLLQFPKTSFIVSISDGTNTFIVIRSELPHPEILKHENQDKLRLVIRDDLSGLLQFRVMASGRREIRER